MRRNEAVNEAKLINKTTLEIYESASPLKVSSHSRADRRARRKEFLMQIYEKRLKDDNLQPRARSQAPKNVLTGAHNYSNICFVLNLEKPS